MGSLRQFLYFPLCFYLVMARVPKLNHGVSLPTDQPLVIAHRGSSGMLPEHTVEAYELAVRQGADVIECDLCVTKDLQLVCLHEPWLNASTNVANFTQFAERVKTYSIFDEANNVTTVKTDYFSVDFTLDELKTLRKMQYRKYRDQNYNGRFQIASFEDFLKVAKNAKRTVGIYVETKAPAWTATLPIMHNTTFEDLVVKEVQKYGYTEATDPCFLQSFSEKSLEIFATKTKLPLVMLVKYSPSNEEFERFSRICYGVGPWKTLIVPSWTSRNGDKNYIKNSTDLIEKAHSFGLKVHPFTFRNEDEFLPWNYGQDPYSEYEKFIELGVDGLFTDFPATLKRYLNCGSEFSLVNSAAINNSFKLRVFLSTLSIILIFYCS